MLACSADVPAGKRDQLVTRTSPVSKFTGQSVTTHIPELFCCCALSDCSMVSHEF